MTRERLKDAGCLVISRAPTLLQEAGQWFSDGSETPLPLYFCGRVVRVQTRKRASRLQNTTSCDM
jgi:hypothetical protein